MDRKAAEDLIKTTFEQPFTEDRYHYFIRELLNQFNDGKAFTYHSAHLPDAYKPHVRSFQRIGTYNSPDGFKIDILAVFLQKEGALERARTMQRNFVARHLKKRSKEAALVAYTSPDLQDWRFSFVRLEYQLQIDDQTGKVKLDESLTPARRYSFLVGANEPNHTAQQQLVKLLAEDEQNPSLASLEKAFGIEVVTEQFFDDYKERFLELKETLDELEASHSRAEEIFSDAELTTANFAKRLMGQIVFLYFLQKKGWLGVRNGQPGPKDFLRQLYEGKWVSYDNFFNEILEPLFYEALAIEHPDDYYPRFNCRIPFLNGGLFEPPQGYDWQSNPLSIPNPVFGAILDAFDRYNFTVREDEPLEKEVAVDPEMLGKVFERLLDVQDRKSKGAFYTPREIVHYMCQQSLIYYLDSALNLKADTIAEAESGQEDLFTRTNAQQKGIDEERNGPVINKEEIEFFNSEGEVIKEHDEAIQAGTKSYKYQLPENVRKHAARIDQALADIKICDPAIGSGAFPVGMMQVIVHARRVLSTYLSTSSQGSDKGVNENRTPYAFKHHAIQHSLYGVDIDPGAVDIAKLRLWLSLVVDEDDFSRVKPLPNLDYKIVTGDTLLGYPYQRRGLEKLEELKRQFFDENDPEIKQKLRESIEQELLEVFKNTEKSLGYQVTMDFRINFSEVFRENEGFDIVIGNPPYIQLQKNGGVLADLYEDAGYDTFTRMGDIYMLFYEKGHRLLSMDGNLCFITSNKWMRAGYGNKLRNYFLKETTPKLLIDFGDAPLFEQATTYTNILLFGHNKRKAQCLVADLSNKNDLLKSLSKYLNSPQDKFVPDFGEKRYLIVNKTESAIKKKVEQKGIPLRDWDVKINYGIKTGYNKAFIIDGETRDEILSKDPKSAEIIKPLLRGKDIKRFSIDWRDEWIIATFPALNLDIKKYPGVERYLKSFGKRIYQTGETYINAQGDERKTRKKTSNEWYETQDQIGYFEEFEKDKIIWAEIVYDSAFYYDEDGYYIEATGFIMTGNKLKYLVSLLNSKLLTYAFKNHFSGGDLRGRTFRYKKAFLEELPIAQADEDIERKLQKLMEAIQDAKRTDPEADTAAMENKIDKWVYSLYGLTEEEINAVEEME